MRDKKYSLIVARGNGKTAAAIKMAERLAKGKCIWCGESSEEGQEICIKCEKCIDAICENGNVYPLTATELQLIRIQTHPESLHKD